VTCSPPTAFHPREIATQAAFFKSFFPAPNSGTSRFAFSPALGARFRQVRCQASPRLSDKDSLVSRYSFVNNNESDPSAYPALAPIPAKPVTECRLELSHIFTPNVTWELAGTTTGPSSISQCSNFNGKDVVSMAGISGFEGISSLQPPRR